MPTWRDPEVAALQTAFAALATPPDAPRPPWSERRPGIDAMGAAMPPPESCLIEAMTLGGVAAEKIAPSNAAADRTIFYLHGGGYCVGGCASHRTLAARMAEAAQATAFVIDYRLAPEHPFPAAHDDALAAWRFVVNSTSAAIRPVSIIAGDSAGGGLPASPAPSLPVTPSCRCRPICT